MHAFFILENCLAIFDEAISMMMINEMILFENAVFNGYSITIVHPHEFLPVNLIPVNKHASVWKTIVSDLMAHPNCPPLVSILNLENFHL